MDSGRTLVPVDNHIVSKRAMYNNSKSKGIPLVLLMSKLRYNSSNVSKERSESMLFRQMKYFMAVVDAKSFTEACGGEFSIQIDADLFTARVTFPLTPPSIALQKPSEA